MLSNSVVLAAQDGPLPPLPHLRPGSLPLARAALLRPLQVPPWVGASGWLPHSQGQHAALRSLVSALHWRHHQHPQHAARAGTPAHWVDGRTWIAAMDYDTGRRVLFGRPDAPHAPFPDAVVASCSIPGAGAPTTPWRRPALRGRRQLVLHLTRAP